MTRRILFASASALALVLAASPGARAADIKSKTFNITANAPQACTLSGFGVDPSSVPTVTYDDTSGALSFALDTNSDTLLDNFNITLNATASCNFNNKVTISTLNGGLQGTGGGGGFSDHVDYTATVTWNGVGIVTLSTDGTTGASDFNTTGAAISGTLAVNMVNATTAGTALVAGNFNDQLTVTIGQDI